MRGVFAEGSAEGFCGLLTFFAKFREFYNDAVKLGIEVGAGELDSEKGFKFFEKFMEDSGIIDELKALGMKEGDTVRLYGWEFEYL